MDETHGTDQQAKFCACVGLNEMHTISDVWKSMKLVTKLELCCLCCAWYVWNLMTLVIKLDCMCCLNRVSNILSVVYGMRRVCYGISHTKLGFMCCLCWNWQVRIFSCYRLKMSWLLCFFCVRLVSEFIFMFYELGDFSYLGCVEESFGTNYMWYEFRKIQNGQRKLK